jgi:sortase A
VIITDKKGQKHIYEVTGIEVVNPYDNSIKTQGDEKELTFLPVPRKEPCVLWSGAFIRRR